ncbi:aminodeoxychorismate synthase component I [Arthrobacter wenxiniae]|uniref:Aminodeoxychorismate synthase component I n=1 Tax=Arthrobacter wenxiniae TaxID=2713570 RepID=A0A7Y7IEM7_9MICC|nr:aminodeoxychorismate synthase component I [Arthrobacter wenxiniae]NVM93615.1 aminodeoxychorismate synthase component I [Arthrobacter wenxiniae]
MRSGPSRPVIIAVDGRSGAGKTTVALELAALLRRHRTVSLFHLEDIYPGWDGLAEGVERYVSTVLAPLAQGRTAHWTAWDWASGDWGPADDAGSRTTAAADVVLVEGVGAAHAAARALVDVVVWVEAPAPARRRRALERDGETYAPFWDRWAAQEDELFAGGDVAAAADIVVDGSRGVAGAPERVLSALAGLPALEPLLAPELARRRGLEFAAVRVAAYPPAAALFAALYGGSTDAVWLDSSTADQTGAGADPAGRARFSIMADASGSFGRTATHADGTTTVADGEVTARIRGHFFRWLDTVWGRKAVRAPDHYPGDFTLGWLGWLGYELKGETGGAAARDAAAAAGATPPGPNTPPGPTPPPTAALLFAGRAVVVDHQERCLFLLTLAEANHPASGQEAADWARGARDAVAALAETDDAPVAPLPAPVFVLRDGESRYKAMIAASRTEIREGNSYEVCLTTQLEAHTPGRLDAWDVYRALRHRSPAPFAAFLRMGATAVCSTSPERFLRIDAAGLMRAEPIKGTRRRDADPVADAALKADLAASLKDRAENVMIVDLLRNDLSHNAVPGTVRVPRLCEIESYATVHQLVSTIEAQLAPGSSRAEALAAAFPAGSMTGAPKISTMAILDSLEAGPRGIYSGGIGYFSLNAALDLSVTIRTLVLQDTDDGGTHLSLGVGGAITADSDDDAEWQEIQAKAYGVLSTLGADFPG